MPAAVALTAVPRSHSERYRLAAAIGVFFASVLFVLSSIFMPSHARASEKKGVADNSDPLPLEMILPPDSPSEPCTDGADFFGDMAAQEQERAEEIEARYSRGRMAFLFGYYKLASEIWTPLARNGHAKAQANIGWMYQTGKGADKNLATALDWYLKAAKQGHEIAQNNVGVMYENGWGTTMDLKRAAHWYREAATVGYSYAQFNLGKMLLDGKGVGKDPKEASYWLGLAALQGVNEARGLLTDAAAWGIADDHARSTRHDKPSNERPNTETDQPATPQFEREPWILHQPAESYTLQLFSNKSEQIVNQYLATQSVPQPAAYYKSNVLGEIWYSVVYGVFPTFEEARRHMTLLPSGVSRYKPWVRKYGDIQQTIGNPVE
jgi:TPR repeat protein